MNAVDPIRSKEEIALFEEAMKSVGSREHILFLLGIYTGLRISDILKLKVSQVRDKSHIELKEQKTGKDKKIFINPNLKRELKVYIQDKDPEEYIIQSREGENKPLTRQSVWITLKKVSDKLGLSGVGCHTLRKTFGYHYYEKSKDVAFLQELFNHSSPKVTLRYIGIDQLHKDNALKNMDFRF